jgi:hypothetical protein
MNSEQQNSNAWRPRILQGKIGRMGLIVSLASLTAIEMLLLLHPG